MVGCPLALAAVLSCRVHVHRWIAPLLAVLHSFVTAADGSCWVTQPVQRTSLWPASWLPAIAKGRGSKSVEVQRVWEVYDERLQFHVSPGCFADWMSPLMLVMFLVHG